MRQLNEGDDGCPFLLLVLAHGEHLIAETRQQQDLALTRVQTPAVRQLQLRLRLIQPVRVDDEDRAANILGATELLCSRAILRRACEGGPVADLVLLEMTSDVGLQPSVQDFLLLFVILVVSCLSCPCAISLVIVFILC